MRVLATSTTTTPTAPTPTVATASTQMPVTRSTAIVILVTVYKLATEQFAEVPHPTARPQNAEHPSVQSSNPQPLEDIPKTPVRQGTSWPSTGSASKNLFKTRKDWPIPPAPASAPTIKTKASPQVVAIPHVMIMPKQVEEKCSWGLHCPVCKHEEKHKEDWDGNIQREQPRMHPQNTQKHQPQNIEQTQSQNIQPPQQQNTQHSQSFDVPDRYSEQIQLRREGREN